MPAIREKFGVRAGYSDHTRGIEVAVAAAALGASVIEKHFTVDKNMKGPDHKSSLEPEDLKQMVRSIRNISKAMGSRKKFPSPSEKINKSMIRKSIVALADIKKGDAFTKENITTKRYKDGISPMRWDEVMGRTAKRNFGKDETITL
jgi:N,N'-diacetyllegionaminate synthase